MAPIKQFPLPDVGEGLTEAEILTWHVRPGDTVTVNQIIVEIETAKAAVELPCPYAGVVTELFADTGTTVQVGSPLIAVDLDPASTVPPAGGTGPGTGAGSGHETTVPPPAAANRGTADQGGGSRDAEHRVPNLVGYGPRTAAVIRRRRRAPVAPTVSSAPTVGEQLVPLAKPPVRKLARELGIDLRSVSGSGTDGVITREDVHRAARPDGDGAGRAAGSGSGRERREPIRGVRKATAAAVVASAFTAPHVTEFLTVDVTPMMELRARLKEHPDFRGVKLTPLAFAAKALCLAARRTPAVNTHWDEPAGEIVYYEHVHLGIAAATPRGLVVPKIRDADRMSLRELAVALDGLATTARDGRTAPADMIGGTITITNVGVYGVDTGTPILNPGESAILALGAIRDMPWVVGGAVAVRKVCQLALSFDHRVVDGQQGSEFLADLGALFSEPALAITY